MLRVGVTPPEAHMFDKSASKPVTTNLTFSWQAVGPYSCSMGEAGEAVVFSLLLLLHGLL